MRLSKEENCLDKS